MKIKIIFILLTLLFLSGCVTSGRNSKVYFYERVSNGMLYTAYCNNCNEKIASYYFIPLDLKNYKNPEFVIWPKVCHKCGKDLNINEKQLQKILKKNGKYR